MDGDYMFKNSLDNFIKEKILLINILGTLNAIKNEKLSINEAEKFLFSPYMISKLKENHYSDRIIDILERGCELEDIVSLLPERLLPNIEELEKRSLEVLGSYQEFDKEFWI
ncbi:MAG: DUF3969 family protein [Lachnospiraceae bacterium]|nr:DUF3969 family protein [Lachnospiraceae bacterium]MDE6251038.1 DUF3969 family protein [Lachnospiraceae bacterium]